MNEGKKHMCFVVLVLIVAILRTSKLVNESFNDETKYDRNTRRERHFWNKQFDWADVDSAVRLRKQKHRAL